MGRIPEGQIEEGGYKSPSIGYLWPHHISMARMFAAGCTPDEVALATGFTGSHISRILGSPAFQSEVARLQEAADEEVVYSVRAEIQRMCGRAVEALDEDLHMEIRTNQERRTRQAAAFGVLERGGYAKPDKPLGPKELHLHKHDHYESPKDMSTEDLAREVLDIAGEDE